MLRELSRTGSTAFALESGAESVGVDATAVAFLGAATAAGWSLLLPRMSLEDVVVDVAGGVGVDDELEEMAVAAAAAAALLFEGVVWGLTGCCC